jgi:metal-responsive CopG/Arc/MetJ family transcriptional regulator
MPTASPVPVRLPADVLHWLDQKAADKAEARATVIRDLLRQAMERDRRLSRRSKPQAHSCEIV